MHDALEALAGVDTRKSQVVGAFWGLSVEETAEALHVSPDTVKRDWMVAKTSLSRELAPGIARYGQEVRNRRDQ